jgi:hypothetical protein
MKQPTKYNYANKRQEAKEHTDWNSIKVSIAMSQNLLDAIDIATRGLYSRSAYVRQAILEKLERETVKPSTELQPCQLT